MKRRTAANKGGGLAGLPPLLATSACTNKEEFWALFQSCFKIGKAKFLSVIILALILGGCSTDPQTVKRVPRLPSAEDGQPADTDRAQEPEEEKEGDAELPAEISEAIEKTKQEPAFEIDLTNFKERLLRLDTDEVSELLGAPNFERTEPPAKIQQYRSNLCIVDIFFFDDEGDLTVDYVDVRGRKVETVDEKKCFANILKAVHEDPQQEPHEDLGPRAPAGEEPEEGSDEDQDPEQPALDAKKVPDLELDTKPDQKPSPAEKSGDATIYWIIKAA